MQYLKIISSFGKSPLIYRFISLLFPVNFRGVSKGGGGGGGGQLTGGQRFAVAPMKQALICTFRS